LREAREARGLTDTALVRVEQLYPFPATELAAVLAAYPAAREVVWVQEEPANMGAWRALRPRFEAVVPSALSLRFVARSSAASPATGFYATHQQQEAALIEAALGDGSALPSGPQGVLVTHAEIRREARS
ncbi:MAG: hypothetical protein ACKO3S_09715, partial [bacterium]